MQFGAGGAVGGTIFTGAVVAGGEVRGTVVATVTGTVAGATVVGGIVGLGLGFGFTVVVVLTLVVDVAATGVDLTALFADEPQPASARNTTPAMAGRERN